MPVPANLATDAFAAESAAQIAATLRPSDPFVFVWHAHQPGNVHVVEVDGAPRVLPILTPCRITPGACSVTSPRESDRPGEHYQAMLARITRDGGTIVPRDLSIPAGLLPPGFPPGGYCRAIPAKNGGKAHIHPWMDEQVEFGGKARLRENLAGLNKWVAWLVDDGHVPPVGPEHINDLRRKTERLRDRARRDTKIPADMREERAGEYDAILSALAAAEAAPTPTKPRPRAKAKETSHE